MMGNSCDRTHPGAQGDKDPKEKTFPNDYWLGSRGQAKAMQAVKAGVETLGSRIAEEAPTLRPSSLAPLKPGAGDSPRSCLGRSEGLRGGRGPGLPPLFFLSIRPIQWS